MAKKSEFGGGLVINLVKFSEYFYNEQASRIDIIEQLKDHLDDEVYVGQYGRVATEAVAYYRIYKRGSYAKNIGAMIEAWANGATDYLFDILATGDLEIDRLIFKLRSKGLSMGHGFTGRVYAYNDMVELRELIKRISVLVDRKLLHLKSPDWGSF